MAFFYNNKNRITKKEQKKIEAEQKRIERKIKLRGTNVEMTLIV